ncbi:MAG: DUF6591 domain-containing protein [Erysipelotrichaceae bacterium]|jgi:RNA polymerase subunit RPABC4/transcription elongation factor Spt4
MFKKSKEVRCKSCQLPMSRYEKICPSCGMENKKIFSRKEWLIAIIVVLFLAGIGYYRKYVADKFQWNSLVLSHVLPQPISEFGDIIVNSDRYLSIDIFKTSKEEYKEYVDRCQAMDFVIEKETSDISYKAFNKEGYKLYLWYDEQDKELSIQLDAPIEMETLIWPNSDIASLLPVPDSSVGKIVIESPDYFSVYIGAMSKDDYNVYVNECYEKGFSLKYYKGDDYYYGNNEEGYEVNIQYEGNNVVYIRIKRL